MVQLLGFLLGLMLGAGSSLLAATAPTIQLASPLHGAFSVEPATVSISATTADADGFVQKVDIFSGTNLLTSLSNAPYQFAWTNVSAGTYELTAVATDDASLSTTSAVASITILTNGASVRVMPLGDSLASGSGYLASLEYPGAYRIRLRQLITNAGLAVDFVGSLTNGPAVLDDFEHEGHPNFFIGPTVPNDEGSFATNLVFWVTNAAPDVILMMLGTMDVLNDHDFTNAPGRLADLIDAVLSNAPNTHIVVSTLTAVDQINDPPEAAARHLRLKAFNAAVPGIVASRAVAGARISFLDGAKAATRFDLVDDANLKTNAFDRLGEFWFGALRPLVTCGPVPRTSLSSPTNNFRFDAPTHLTLTTTASDWLSGIQKVEFYQDNVKIGEASNAPYSMVISNLASGHFSFAARAVSSNGSAAVSTSSNIRDNWTFITGVNVFNGAATIEGENWQSWFDATNSGGLTASTNFTYLSQSYASPLVPPTHDPNVDYMFRTLGYGPTGTNSPLELHQALSNGYYRFYLWMLEDFADYSRELNIRAEGVLVATNVLNVPRYTWRKLGPYAAIVADGSLDIEIAAACDTCGAPAVYGFTILQLPVTNQPPILSLVSNQTINENQSLGPLNFTATDDFTAASNLVLTALSTDPTLFPTNQLVFGGSDTNRTITLTPATNTFGNAQITIVATDDLGITNSINFSVTVTDVDNPPLAFSTNYTLAEEAFVNFTLNGIDPDGSNLTFTVLSLPAHGLLSGTAPNLTYTPASNYFGADALTFNAFDGTLTSTVATISFTITNVNDVPVVTNQPLAIDEDTPVFITLNRFDADNDLLTFAIVGNPTNGTLTGFNATNGTVNYRPATNFFGADSFTFFAFDSASTSIVATVSITINSVNDTPVGSNQLIVIGSLTNTPITLAGFDVETDSSNLIFTVTGNPTNGMLSGTAPNLVYTPDPGFVEDHFQFTASDGSLTSAVATVSIRTNQPGTVALINPVHGAFASAPANITLVATATDPEGAVSSISFFEGTNFLGLATNHPYFLIWSNVAAGNYSFTAVMQDEWGLAVTSAVSSVSILSNGIPIRVMPTGDSITDGSGYAGEYPGAYRVRLWQLLTNAGINVDFVGSFTNGPAELVDNSHQARGGAVIGPSTNFNNLYDSMAAWLSVAPADIVLLQAGANDVLGQDDLINAPARLGGLIDLIQSNLPNAHVLAAQINTMVPFSLHEIDSDLRVRAFNRELPAQIESRYLAGKRVSLVDNHSALTRYDLADGVHPSSAGYDLMGASIYARLHPLVTCKAAPLVRITSPLANNPFLAPTNLTLSVDAEDMDGSVVRVEFYKDNEKIVVLTNAPWTITLTNFGSGSFRFTARAVDDDGAAAIDSIVIRDEWEFVTGVNVAGPAVPVDGYTWWSFATAISNGLTYSTNTLVFSNQAGYMFQSPSFQHDPVGDPSIDLASRTLLYGNLNPEEFFSLHQPVANGTYHLYVWMIEAFLSNGRQTGLRLEEQTLTTNIGTLPLSQWRKYGPYTATVSDGRLDIDFVNQLGFFGNPAFFGMALYRNAGSIVPPVLSSIGNQFGMPGDTFGPLPFIVTDADTAPEALTLLAESSNTNLIPITNIVINGTGTNRTITLTAMSNIVGAATITIAAHDNAYGVAKTMFVVNISGTTNSAPSATPQNLTLAEDSPLPITLTGTDPETNALTFTLVSLPTNGVLSGMAPNVTYQPATNFFGADSFTFSVSDGQLTSSVATVSLTITNLNDAPVATNQSIGGTEEVPLLITLNVSDVDSSSFTFAILTNPLHGNLSFFNSSLGTATYTPHPDFAGTDSLAFTVTDGQLTSAIAMVTLTITNVNDPPMATNQSLTVTEDVPQPVVFNVTDVDSTNFTFAIVTNPASGALLEFSAANGTATYQPATNFFGPDTIAFTVTDGQLTSSVAVVSLNVTNVNDAPVASNLTLFVTANTNNALTLPASDADGDALTFALQASPTNGLTGMVDATNGSFSYTPAHAFYGQDTIQFTVTDTLLSSTGMVTLSILTPNDTDGDGIPDYWETAHGLSTATNDATLDPDGDGRTNLEEYFGNTDPLESRYGLRISTMSVLSNGNFLVTWDAVAGVRYRITFSDGTAGGKYTNSFSAVPRAVEIEMPAGPLGSTTNQTFLDDFTISGPPVTPGFRYFKIETVR